MPWCTYADPELASIGMNEKAARAAGIEYQVWSEELRSRYEITWPFFNFVRAPYTPQGGTEKSAVPRISAMLFFYNGLRQRPQPGRG
ncbi:MAG: hypothetical protein AB1461_17240 [Thermodesulfobacteriota bacterium]